MVHLELERRHIPFSWRYFDAESPLLKELLPDFHPDFTLREYRIVINVSGGFWGNLPGVLDRIAIAKTLLEAEGWKFVNFFEADIRSGVGELIDKELPQLRVPDVTGEFRPNPYGTAPFKRFMEWRKLQLKAAAARRRVFKTEGPTGGSSIADAGRRRANRRRNRLRRRSSD